MKLTFDAPVILSFTFLSLLVLGVKFIAGEHVFWLFTSPAHFDFAAPTDYIRLFSYSLGHANWQHFLANFSLALLLGPILEKRFGSWWLLLLMSITILTTALLHAAFFSERLTGISGVVFMFITLVPLQQMEKGKLPLTFVLILLIYLGQEFFRVFRHDEISQFAHLMGGGMGILLGRVMKGRMEESQKGPSNEPIAGR